MRGHMTILRNIDQVRLMYDRLTDFVDMEQLESCGLLLDQLPLHVSSELEKLEQNWGDPRKVFSLYQPIQDIRDYFWEEIAFYSFFLRELIKAVLPLFILALGCQACYVFGDSELARPMLSLIILIWFRVFTKRWRHVEAEFANSWGTEAHGISSVKWLQNVRFRGVLSPSPEDNSLLRPQVSWARSTTGMAASVALTSLFVMVMIVVVITEHTIFFHLCIVYVAPNQRQLLSSALGAVMGTQIKVVDSIWDRVSDCITDLECHPSKFAFTSSKRTKAVVVRLITSMCSPIAFLLVKFMLQDPSEGSTGMLASNMMSTLLTCYLLLGCFLMTLRNCCFEFTACLIG
ncbi:unnamed protein product [Polarella glacialis]|uniref:Anoctamin transmembrane domain-containing protein n=1 Tax=Polarella glacialis TaxID=89957 RepID=A0A813GT53_POLGL|nr:unnamed protein product [Polarella glacialis]